MTEQTDETHIFASAEAAAGVNRPPEILPILPMDITEEEMAAKRDAFKAAAEPDAVRETAYNDDAHFALRTRVSAFAEAAGKWKDIKQIGSKAQSERLTDFIKGAIGLAKKVEAQRKTDKEVWDAKGAAVQAAYKPLTDVLEKISKLMKPMQSDWLDREQKRLDDEKAAAAAAAKEKADAAAAELLRATQSNDVTGIVAAEALAKEAVKETKAANREVRASAGSASGGGRAMSVRTTAYAIIENQNAVYMQFRENPRVVEVLQSLADAAIRAGEEVKGASRGEKSGVA